MLHNVCLTCYLPSSPLSSPGQLKVALNVESLPARFWSCGGGGGCGDGGLQAERLGLASGWLEKAAALAQQSELSHATSVQVRVCSCFQLLIL